MPEYSSTTITPSDGVQVPGMNGSTSGNFLLSALRDFILASKGQANGLASLGSDGKLTASQLPDLADDVIVVASYATLPAIGTAGKIYITADNNKMYRWDPDLTTPNYVELSVDLSAYATKAELAEEESDREAADSNLLSAITAIDHRVENLEQPKGGYVVENYKDGAITPSGKGKWCVVEGVEGVSRVENNIARGAYSRVVAGLKITYDSTTYRTTITGTANETGDYTFFSQAQSDYVAGHKYLLVTNCKTSLRLTTSGANSDFTNSTLFTFSSGTVFLGINAVNGTTYNEDFYICIKDLNIYFNTTDLSFLGATDSAKLATIQTNYPHLLTPSEYGTRIVDSSYSGVRAWARNLFNPTDFEIGDIASDTGANITSSMAGRCKDYIPVKPNTLYYFYDQTINALKMRYYDINKNYIGFSDKTDGTNAQNQTRLMPDNCFYIRFAINGVTSIADNAICVNLSDSNNGTYTPYHAPNTLSFPSTSLKSAGSVRDTLELNVEVGGVAKKRETTRVGSVDLGSLTWNYEDATQRFYAIISDAKKASAIGNTVLIEAIQPLPYKRLFTDTEHGYEYMIANIANEDDAFWFYTNISNQTSIQIKDTTYNSVGSASDPSSFLGHLQGKYLNYELSTPVVTLSDPLIDNTLLTESGGRMATVQTGTVVDGSFDMGFINL